MKFNKRILFNICSYIGIIIFLIVSLILFSQNITPIQKNEIKTILICVYLISIILMIGFTCVIINELLNGYYYTELLKIPMKDFKIDVYENLYIFNYKGKAYPVMSCYKKILEKKFITVKVYYNRKKIKKHYDVHLPYFTNR